MNCVASANDFSDDVFMIADAFRKAGVSFVILAILSFGPLLYGTALTHPVCLPFVCYSTDRMKTLESY